MCKSCFRIHDILGSCSFFLAGTDAGIDLSHPGWHWSDRGATNPDTPIYSNEFSTCTNTNHPSSRHNLFHTNNSLRIPHGVACRYRYLCSFTVCFCCLSAKIPRCSTSEDGLFFPHYIMNGVRQAVFAFSPTLHRCWGFPEFGHNGSSEAATSQTTIKSSWVYEIIISFLFFSLHTKKRTY